MKSLLYVVKTLLQINGAVALLLMLFVLALRGQRPVIVGESPKPNNQSKSFHRKIQEIPTDYQRKLDENQQKLREKEQHIQQLQASLKAYERSNQQLRATILANPSATPTEKLVAVPVQKVNQIPASPSTDQPTAQDQQQSQIGSTLKTASNPSSEPPPAEKPQDQSLIPNAEESKLNVIMTAELIQEDPIEPLTSSLPPKQEPLSQELKDDYQLEVTRFSQPIVLSNAQTPLEPSIRLANDLTVGLLIAQKERHVKYQSGTYRKVQTAIRSLRKGSSNSLEEAANLSRLNSSLLEKLAKWGQKRPGSLDAQISLADPS